MKMIKQEMKEETRKNDSMITIQLNYSLIIKQQLKNSNFQAPNMSLLPNHIKGHSRLLVTNRSKQLCVCCVMSLVMLLVAF